VLPAALSLRRKGASREATIAFLITTPETGVDSIALTYGLLGPFMAIARPLAAILTGIVAGVLSMREPEAAEILEAPASEGNRHTHESAVKKQKERPHPDLRRRLRHSVQYAFGPLLDDLAFWLLVAFVITGVLSATLPSDFFLRFLPAGLPSLVAMAILGIPTYVCASASTTVAAAMIAKGLSPGAALVFMLTGPATNASTAGIVARLFGRRFILVYLAAIFGVAIAAGAFVDAVIDPNWTLASAAWEDDIRWAWVGTIAGLILGVLMARSLFRTGLRPGLAEMGGHLHALTSWGRGIDWRGLPWRRAVRTSVPFAVAAYLLMGVVIVGPGEEGIGRIFGSVSGGRLSPGIHLFWPAPIGRVDVVSSAAVRTVEIGYASLPGEAPRPGRGARTAALPASFPATTAGFGTPRTSLIPEGAFFVTGDETLVAVTAVVLYEVADPSLYLLGVDRPDALVRAVARRALVEVIGRTPIDALYSSARGDVETAVLTQLCASPTLKGIGVRPTTVNLLYVHAPDAVHAAFRDVASAAEDRTTLQNLAHVETESSVRRARGDAARQVAEAEAYEIQQVERAQGNAAAFTPLAAEDRRAGAVMRSRLYLESMERVLARKPKLIKPGSKRSVGLELWVTPSDEAGGPPFVGAGIPGGTLPMDDEGSASPRPSPSARAQ
jgi:HflK protein